MKKNEKMKKGAGESGLPVRGLFAVFFVGILLLLLFGGGMEYVCKKTFRIPNWLCMLLGFSWVSLCALVWAFLGRKHTLRVETSFDKYADRLVRGMTIALFFLQVYISCQIFEANTWDPDYMWELAEAWVNGEDAWYAYFSRYPNNLLLHFLEVFCIRFNRNFGIFPGGHERMSAVVVDCATISGACYLTYRLLTLFTEKTKAFAGYLICLVLAGLSPWMSICYSDSLAILFPVLTLYLYTKPYKKLPAKAGKCLAVVAACVGYSIKPQSIVVLIAILCVELLFAIQKRSGKRGLEALLLAILMVGCLKINSQLLIGQCVRSGRGFQPEMEYGMSHFFAMGLNTETGGFYASEDVIRSGEIETRAERNRVNLQIAAERLKRMGPAGYARHLSKKIMTAYNDGTFAWGNDGFSLGPVTEDMNGRMTHWLRSYYWITGSRHEYMKTLDQLVWMMVLLFAACSALYPRKGQHNFTISVLQLSLVGLTMFQMLFEVRARYLFLYAPFYCILAVVGMSEYGKRVKKIVEKLRKR